MNNKNWWCPQCNCEVAPENVTFTELHDEKKGGCGDPVLEQKPIKAMTLKQLAEKVKAVYGKCYVSLQGELVSTTNGEDTIEYHIYISFQGVGADITKPTISENFNSLTDLESYVNSLSRTPTIDTDINPQVFGETDLNEIYHIETTKYEETE